MIVVTDQQNPVYNLPDNVRVIELDQTHNLHNQLSSNLLDNQQRAEFVVRERMITVCEPFHRLWTEILAVAARAPSMRETFASSDKAMRKVFVELLQKAAEAREIDGSLDLDAVSVWLYAQ